LLDGRSIPNRIVNRAQPVAHSRGIAFHPHFTRAQKLVAGGVIAGRRSANCSTPAQRQLLSLSDVGPFVLPGSDSERWLSVQDVEAKALNKPLE
jgi:hypothetical protein